MKEIGGYIELDRYTFPMLHDGAVALNCARNALAYLIRARKIKKILLPRFLCASVKEVCDQEEIIVRYYSIGLDFRPQNISLAEDEWLYVVNYYGQLENAYIHKLAETLHRVIIDNVQAYFQMPVNGVDTIYTCRKYFGVADGAFLYTTAQLFEKIPQDESFRRMTFLLGRFERTASEFYGQYVANNDLFSSEPIKKMSKLTDNLLHAIDYEAVKQRRTENFAYLHQFFEKINKLNLVVPEGAFMYPLYIENGAQIRKDLQAKKIYIPTFWPDVFDICEDTENEYNMAANILPLPVDQRYSISDMEYLRSVINEYKR